MTATDVINALRIPAEARIDQRVPKKMLVENGAQTASDKRQINFLVEELLWIASLKPASIGVPIYRDDVREYLEIAILSLTLRAGTKVSRLTELIHRAIPYPIFLIQIQPATIALSLAHLRRSIGQATQTVLEGQVITTTLGPKSIAAASFLCSLEIAHLPRGNLHALYQGWVELFEAHAAAQHTGKFSPSLNSDANEHRRKALVNYKHMSQEVNALRSLAKKENQLSRRVEINLQIKKIESRLAEAAKHL